MIREVDWEELPWTGKLLVAVLFCLTKWAWSFLVIWESAGWA